MIRIFLILSALLILYLIIKSLINKNSKSYKKLKKNISYCKYCDIYMPTEEKCSEKNEDYNKCKNFKKR